MRHALLPTLLLGLAGHLAPVASAQNMAAAKLYTRVEDDTIRAALEVRIEPGWYLYHTERGHPDAVSKPLSLTFGGEGITWSTPRLPEPHRHDADFPEGTWDWIHTGRITIHALGELADGADGADASVALDGLTCSDVEGTCIPYDEKVTTSGKGRDKHFADFPADLAVGGAAPAAGSASGGGGAAPGAQAVDPFAAGTSPGAGSAGSGVPPRAASSGWKPRFGPDSPVDGRLFVRVADGEATVVVELKMEKGWHVYHGPTQEDLGPADAVGMPTTITLEGAGFELGPLTYPTPERIEQPGAGEGGKDTWIFGYHDSALFRATGSVEEGADPKALRAVVSGLTCKESCIPFDLDLEAAGEGPDELFAAAGLEGAGGILPPEGGGAQGGSLTNFLLLAVFWGLFTLLMPCTYPMIPITISFFTKQAIARDGKVLSLALAYGAGIVLIFILIGVVIGAPILAFAAHPVTNLVIGALFVFFAFVLFGAIDLRPPAFLMNVAGKASMRGGYGGVFLMGATLVVTSFTCTAPFVGSLLAVGAEAGAGLGRIVLGMGVFGLTMATPFVLLSLLPGKMQQIPKAGEWMDVLKVFLGFVELAAALKFLSNVDLMWDWGLLSRELFLVLWMGIFLCAAMFLFGWIKLKGKESEGIGPVRMVSGVGTFLFALYCGMGVIGFVMDDIMTAIIPNYSTERLAGIGFGGESGEARVRHRIVVDDYEAARQAAVAEQKLLLVNFTGIT